MKAKRDSFTESRFWLYLADKALNARERVMSWEPFKSQRAVAIILLLRKAEVSRSLIVPKLRPALRENRGLRKLFLKT